MKSKRNETKKKNTFGKIFGFSLLFFASASAAIVAPIIIDKNIKPSLNLNNSVDSYENNKIRTNYFVDQVLNPNYYKLSSSLKIYGKDGVIGTTDTELTMSERSLISVKDAYENGMFKFEITEPSILYQMIKVYNINYELAYIRPFNNDSSYATVGIKLYAGENSSYYETIFEYKETSIYGFKRVYQEKQLEDHIKDIELNASKYFQLNNSVGKVGDVGIYAKNIKVENLNTNTEKVKDLNKNDFFIQINSCYSDSTNPTLLRINFLISYEKNDEMYYKNSYTYLSGFDIELGVDDPVSKLKNFIKDQESWLNNLYQYFKYEAPEDLETKYTVREAYEKGLIKFEETYAIQNNLDSRGISLQFKTFEEEQTYINKTGKKNELTVSNYINDSTTPMYRIYLTSYSNTPLEYTESFLIEGLNQEGQFKISDQEKSMEALNEYLIQETKGFEDIFELNKTNPIPLNVNYFKDDATFANNKYPIPFEIVNELYKKYTSDENQIYEHYDAPFAGTFTFTLKNEIINNLPTDFKYNEEIFNLNEIVNQILSSMNDSTQTWDEQITELDNTTIKFRVTNGKKSEGNVFESLNWLEINVSSIFTNYTEYLRTQLTNIENTLNQNNIFIVLSQGVNNKETIKLWLSERKFNSIFSNVFIYNTNTQIKYPELLPSLETEIDFSYFNSLTLEQINKINETETITINIKISLNNTSKFIKVTKTFTEILESNKI